MQAQRWLLAAIQNAESQSLCFQGFMQAEIDMTNVKAVHVSIPLFSGLHASKLGDEVEIPEEVSIPLFSGLHASDGDADANVKAASLNPFVFRASCKQFIHRRYTMIKNGSQSLCFQGFMQAAAMTPSAKRGLSQSLCFQGFMQAHEHRVVEVLSRVSIPLFSGLHASVGCVCESVHGDCLNPFVFRASCKPAQVTRDLNPIGSQSLCFQGFMQAHGYEYKRADSNVSIPLFSGLHASLGTLKIMLWVQLVSIPLFSGLHASERRPV